MKSSIAARNYSSQYTASELEKDEADSRLRMLKHLLALDEENDIFTKNNVNSSEITTLDWSNLRGITGEVHIEFLVNQVKNGKLNRLKCLYLPYHAVLNHQSDALIEALTRHPSIEIISWFPQCQNHPPPRMREHLAFSSGSGWYVPDNQEDLKSTCTKISLEHPCDRFGPNVTTTNFIQGNNSNGRSNIPLSSMGSTPAVHHMNTNNNNIGEVHPLMVDDDDERGTILDGGFIIDEGDSTHQSLLQEEKDLREQQQQQKNNNEENDHKKLLLDHHTNITSRNSSNLHKKQHLSSPTSALSSFSRPQGQMSPGLQLLEQPEELIPIEEMEGRWFTLGKLIQATKETPSLVCVCLPPSFVPEQEQLSRELQVQLFQLDEAVKLQQQQLQETQVTKHKKKKRLSAKKSGSVKFTRQNSYDDEDDEGDDNNDDDREEDDDEEEEMDDDEPDIVDAFNNNSSTASYFYQQYFSYFINQQQQQQSTLLTPASHNISGKDFSSHNRVASPASPPLAPSQTRTATSAGLMHLIKLFSSYKNFTLRQYPPPPQSLPQPHREQRHRINNEQQLQQPQSFLTTPTTSQANVFVSNNTSNNNLQMLITPGHSVSQQNVFSGSSDALHPNLNFANNKNKHEATNADNATAITNHFYHSSSSSNTAASRLCSTIESTIFGPATEAVVRVFARSPDVGIFRDLETFLKAQKSKKFHRDDEENDNNNDGDEDDAEDDGAVHPVIVAAVLRGLLDYCLTINQLKEPVLVSRMWDILEALLADTAHVASISPSMKTRKSKKRNNGDDNHHDDQRGGEDEEENDEDSASSLKPRGRGMPGNTLSLVFLQDALLSAFSSGKVGVGLLDCDADDAHSASSQLLAFSQEEKNNSSGRIKTEDEVQEEREFQEKLAAIERLPAFRQQDALYQLTAERNKKLQQLNNINGNNNNNSALLSYMTLSKSPKAGPSLLLFDNNNNNNNDNGIPTTSSGADFHDTESIAAVSGGGTTEPVSRVLSNHALLASYQHQNHQQNQQQHSSTVPVCRYDKETLHLALDLILMSPFGLPRMTVDFWNKLTTVDLSNQGRLFGDEGAALVAKLLRQSGGILPVERLALRSNHISDVGFEYLVRAVFESENQYLREMDLRHNVIADSAARAVIPELRVVRCVLRTMLVEDNAISQETASLLATGLLLCGQPAAVRRTVANLEDETGDACRAVELSRCGLDDLGCKLLLQAIRKRNAFETLVSVDLSCNRITDDGASVAARIIDACQALKTMNLCENEIGVRGAEALIISASARRSLSRLDLADQKPKPLPEHTLKRMEFAIALHGAPLTTQHQVASVIRGDPSATKVSFNKIAESSFLRLSTHHIRVALAAVRDAPKGKIAIRSLEIRDHASDFPLCDISQILSDVFLTVSVRKIMVLDLSGNGLDHKCANVLCGFLSSSSSSGSNNSAMYLGNTMNNNNTYSATMIQLGGTLSSPSTSFIDNNNNTNNKSCEAGGGVNETNILANFLDQTVKGGWCSSLRELYLDNNNFSATAADAFAEVCLRRNTNLTKLSLEGNPSISQSQLFDVSLACDMNFLGTNLKQKLVDLMSVEKKLSGNYHHHQNHQASYPTPSASPPSHNSPILSSSPTNNNGSIPMITTSIGGSLPPSSAAFVEIDVTPFLSSTSGTTKGIKMMIQDGGGAASPHHNSSFGSLREFASFRKQNDATAHYNNYGNPTTRFGDFGARVFANVLMRLPRVKSIILQKCAISDAGAEYLGKNLLHSHPSLTSVDLSHNNISAVGAQYLLDALKSNPRLQQLLLDGNACSMDPSLYRDLLNTLKNNRQLASCAKGGENNANRNNGNQQHQQQPGNNSIEADSTPTPSSLQKQQEKANEVYENRTLFDEDKIKPKLKVTSNNKEYDESVRDYLREERRVEDAIFLDAMQSHWRGLHGNYQRQTPKRSAASTAVKRSIVYQNFSGVNDDDDDDKRDNDHDDHESAVSFAARHMENSAALSAEVNVGSHNSSSANNNQRLHNAVVPALDPSAPSVLASRLIPRAEHEFSNIRTQQLQEQQAIMMIGNKNNSSNNNNNNTVNKNGKKAQKHLGPDASDVSRGGGFLIRNHDRERSQNSEEDENDESSEKKSRKRSTSGERKSRKRKSKSSVTDSGTTNAVDDNYSELAGSPATALMRNRRK